MGGKVDRCGRDLLGGRLITVCQTGGSQCQCQSHSDPHKQTHKEKKKILQERMRRTHCPPQGRSRPMTRELGSRRPVYTAQFAVLPEYGCTFTPHCSGSTWKAFWMDGWMWCCQPTPVASFVITITHERLQESSERGTNGKGTTTAEIFDLVDDFVASIVASSGETLRVLVCEAASERVEDRRGRKVLRFEGSCV